MGQDIRIEGAPLPDIYTSDIKGCARCGLDHNDLRFKILKNPVRSSPYFTHWTMCPNLDEPILMAFIYTED